MEHVKQNRVVAKSNHPGIILGQLVEIRKASGSDENEEEKLIRIQITESFRHSLDMSILQILSAHWVIREDIYTLKTMHLQGQVLRRLP